MSASGGSRAIIAALLANLGIAAAKFVAWVISGSASMLAEGIHSVADSGNQLLLLFGQRQARKAADDEHPFGYGRERYVYAFVVAIILFSVGGVFSLYEGWGKLNDLGHGIENPWVPLIVLVVAIGLESYSLRTALHESKPMREGISVFKFIRRAKSPELPVVLLEDMAALTGLVLALLGVGLTMITGNALFDALGTLAIGALLVLVAIVLGIETKSLLVGEGASPAHVASIRAAIMDGDEVEEIVHLKTLYVGPDELMVGAKLVLPNGRTLHQTTDQVDAIEARIREQVPIARIIYIEPAERRGGTGAPTEAVVIRAAD